MDKIKRETDVRVKQTSVYNLSDHITDDTASIKPSTNEILM